MKMLRRSEFVAELAKPGGRPRILGAQAERAAEAAELAGVEWLPEEPELPERISADSLRVLGDPPITQALRAEAARRYNAWGKLRKWLEEEAACRSGNYCYVMGLVLDKLDSLFSEEN